MNKKDVLMKIAPHLITITIMIFTAVYESGQVTQKNKELVQKVTKLATIQITQLKTLESLSRRLENTNTTLHAVDAKADRIDAGNEHFISRVDIDKDMSSIMTRMQNMFNEYMIVQINLNATNQRSKIWQALKKGSYRLPF